MNNRFLRALDKQKRSTEQHNPLIAGTLGIVQGGVQVVEVPDRASYVYVQVRSSQAEVIQAFNARVSPVYGLPVLIQWQGNRYIIFDRDSMRYSNWIDSSSYLPRHASTHEFEGSAGDVVYVSQEQFLPLMPMPSGSNGNKQVVVGHYNLMSTGGTFSYFPTQATANLTAWNPSSPTGAQMVLISIDASNGNFHYDVGSGSVFGNWLTGSADVLPHVPAVPDVARYLPVAAVRLIQGTTTITWDNIYDVRPLFGVTRGISSAGGGGGGSSSGVAVLNNGILENYANQLNLLGSQFTLTHSGTEAELTLLGGGGASGSLLLDTSNGPLFGPLVVYQKNPNNINQFGDYSTIVAFLSGTIATNSAAGVHIQNYSTGQGRAYGLLIDDYGAGQVFQGGAWNAVVDNTAFYLEHDLDNSRIAPYFSAMAQLIRNGNNRANYMGPLLLLTQADFYDTGPGLEIDVGFGAKTALFPTFTGRPFGFSFQFPSVGDVAYYFDTANQLSTGMVHTAWNHFTEVEMWFEPDGRLSMNQLKIRETPLNFSPHSGGSFSMGEVPLVAGTASVRSGPVTMSSRIFLTVQNGSGSHVGTPYVYSRMPGSGFTIRSTDLQDVSRVAWIVVEPA